MASRVTGAKKLRRTLRRAPDEIADGVREPVRSAAQTVEREARARVPVREGDLKASIQTRFGRDKLTAVVGPGASAAEIARRRSGTSAFGAARRGIRLSRRNKALLWEYFKGYWIEFGTKGSPRHNIPPLPARPFMGPAGDIADSDFREDARRAVGAALDRLTRT